MKCLNCHEEIPDHVRSCVVCGTDAGYPNVRAALRNEEVSALKLRVKEAEEWGKMTLVDTKVGVKY